MVYFLPSKFDRVRAGSAYRFEPVMIDRLHPQYNVREADVVCIMNLRGFLKANTMRHAHVMHLDGTVRRSGLHQLTPMQREQ
jgi:hypothetical protein